MSSCCSALRPAAWTTASRSLCSRSLWSRALANASSGAMGQHCISLMTWLHEVRQVAVSIALAVSTTKHLLCSSSLPRLRLMGEIQVEIGLEWWLNFCMRYRSANNSQCLIETISKHSKHTWRNYALQRLTVHCRISSYASYIAVHYSTSHCCSALHFFTFTFILGSRYMHTNACTYNAFAL